MQPIGPGSGRTWRVVVMGVAGSGKTAVARRLAHELMVRFVDADDLHPERNVDKMRRGEPLDDTDRAPWLEHVREALRSPDGVVVACSALARRHRDVLRGAEGVRFVFLDLDPATARSRVEHRSGHFLAGGLVQSQFDTLERPHDEPDVATVDATQPLDVVVRDTAAVFG